MAPVPTHLLPGRPDPLVANWDGLGVNFAVFSANAERIDLCLFDPSGRREVARLPLPEPCEPRRIGMVWSRSSVRIRQVNALLEEGRAELLPGRA